MHVAKNSCCEAFVGCTLLSQNWLVKEAASAVVRIWCSLWVHAGCCEPAVRGLFALLGDVSRVTCTQSAPPERALFRTYGFCGASGDARARGVNSGSREICKPAMFKKLDKVQQPHIDKLRPGDSYRRPSTWFCGGGRGWRSGPIPVNAPRYVLRENVWSASHARPLELVRRES